MLAGGGVFGDLFGDFVYADGDAYPYNFLVASDAGDYLYSRGDKHRFYVVDFAQGYPLITLDTILSAYQPSGFISLEGSKLVFDYTFDAHYYQDFSTQGHPTLASYPLMDYERLVEETRGMVEGVVEEALEQGEE